MTEAELKQLKDGQLVNYGFFRNLIFRGTKGGYVLLEDSSQEVREFQRSLLLKYGDTIQPPQQR